jgi:hypothetical protein
MFLKKAQDCKASKLGGGRILTHGQSAQHLSNWIFIQVSSICNPLCETGFGCKLAFLCKEIKIVILASLTGT